MVFLMAVTFTHAQITTANNGLNATGTDPNKTVGLGGTLLDAQAAIDFNNSFSNSSFLLKKGTSNYFYVGNNGNIGVGNNSPAQKLDVTGMIQSSTGFKYGSTIGANLEAYGTYSRLISNSTTDGLLFWTDKTPSSIKFVINGATRGLVLDGSTSNLLFMDGSGNSLGGIGSANGTGHLALLYSTAINSHTEGARLTNTGNFGIGTTAPTYKLNVNGNAEIGDGHDPTGYGQLQIIRPTNQPDNKFHLSFIGAGVSVGGMGYGQNSTTLGIWTAVNNSAAPVIGFTPTQRVGIGVLNPAFKLDMDSPSNDGGNGDTRFRIANTSASGSNNAGSRPTIEVLGARGDGNISFEGKLALGTRRTDGNALSNQTLGAILFGGQHGTDQTFQSSKILYPASIQGLAEGTFSNASAMPTGIAFFTSSTGNDAGAANLSYGTERMRIGSNGSVGIGTTNIADNGYKLFVELGIRTRKVKVDQASWSDFVFEKDYDLPTLTEVEQFIQKNKHLPGVPSANEVEKNGLDVGETQALLLQKIEELTLYVIQLKKEIEELKNDKKH